MRNLTKQALVDLKSQLRVVYRSLSQVGQSKADGKSARPQVTTTLNGFYNTAAVLMGYTSISHMNVQTSDKETHGKTDIRDFLNLNELKAQVATFFPDASEAELTKAFWIFDVIPSMPFINEFSKAFNGNLINLSEAIISSEATSARWKEINGSYIGFLEHLSEIDYAIQNDQWTIFQRDQGSEAILLTPQGTIEELESYIASNITTLRLAYVSQKASDIEARLSVQTKPNRPVMKDMDINLGYFEIHNETERALFSGMQLKYLRFLAGSVNLPPIDIGDTEFISAIYLVDDMITRAKSIAAEFKSQQQSYAASISEENGFIRLNSSHKLQVSNGCLTVNNLPFMVDYPATDAIYEVKTDNATRFLVCEHNGSRITIPANWVLGQFL